MKVGRLGHRPARAKQDAVIPSWQLNIHEPRKSLLRVSSVTSLALKTLVTFNNLSKQLADLALQQFHLQRQKQSKRLPLEQQGTR